MVEKESKEEIKVEDRRMFDRDGNVIHEAPPQQPKPEPPQEPKPQPAASSGPEEKIDFVSILYSYVHSALVYLGEVEDPIQRKKVENLEGAQEMIDILEMMQKKTKGNLESREEQFLENVLFDLRMRYLKKSQVVK